MEQYVVSARKYRPVTFESVVGQSHITSTLKNAIERGQMAHAYLFCGPRGVGKTTCARILAKTINCSSPKEGMEPCDSCESCKAFNSSSSFNIHEIDAASNSSVENMRRLTEQVRVPPQLGRFSVYIIDEVHMLSSAAFNAFLKTLEEPPAHAIFILATTEKHKVLPTILSRCQIYDFRRIKVDDIVMQLKSISQKEGVTSDEESLHLIAQKSDGCMRDALSMYDKVVSFSSANLTLQSTATSLNLLDYDSYFSFLRYLRDGDFQSALLLFDSILQRGFEPSIFIAGLQMHLRDMLMAKNSSTLSLLEMTPALRERFQGEAAGYELPFIYSLMELLSGCEESLKRSLNQRLTVELTIIKGSNFYGRVAEPVKREQAVLSQVKVDAEQVSAAVEKRVDTKSDSSVKIVEKEQKTEVIHEPVVVEKPKVIEKPIEKPQIIHEPVAPKPEVEQSKPQQQRQRVSSIGLSIGSIMEQSEKKELPTSEKSDQSLSDSNFKRVEDESGVLSLSRSYAESIKESRPRFYALFASAGFAGGVALITAANQIVAEELERAKQDILSEMAAISGGSYIDFTVRIEEYKQETENLLIKDEDKMKFMIERNSKISDLCAKLTLDFE